MVPPERTLEGARPSEPGEPDAEEVTEHAPAGCAGDRNACSRLGRRDTIARGWHEANPVLADPDLALAGDRPRAGRDSDAEDRRVRGRRRRRVGYDDLDTHQASGASEWVDERGASASGFLAPLGPGQLVLDEERWLCPPGERRKRALPRH